MKCIGMYSYAILGGFHNMERQLGLSEHRADQDMLDKGFSFDFLALCDAGWVGSTPSRSKG